MMARSMLLKSMGADRPGFLAVHVVDDGIILMLSYKHLQLPA